MIGSAEMIGMMEVGGNGGAHMNSLAVTKWYGHERCWKMGALTLMT